MGLLMLLGGDTPESLGGWIWRAFDVLATGCVVAIVGWDTISPHLHFPVLGNRTLAIYDPYRKSRLFLHKDDCVGYRPVSNALVTRDGRVHRLTLGQLPFWQPRVLKLSEVAALWWPDISNDVTVQMSEVRNRPPSLVLSVISGSSVFLVSLAWLFGNAALGLTALLCCLVFFFAAWVLGRDSRRQIQIELPVRVEAKPAHEIYGNEL